uniref:Pentatricopeptide repeat-containing protein At3g53360, mitochondrial n=1 Tax=Cajanus cajan TaxID=3821 RepID=A0A151TV10_CAJCA|nr:hypothetical protein KK1_010086 [Cajanus cajan]
MIIQSQIRCIYNYVRPIVPTTTISGLSTELSTNSYINLMCKQQHYREALDAFNFHLKNSSIQLEPSTYVNLILACTNSRSLKYGKKIHDHILKSNYQPNLVLQNHILNMYGKCGSLKDARKVFDAMQLRNVVSWTIMISGYSQNGQENDAIIMYIQMLQSGYFPDQLTFGSIIKACCNVGDIELGRQLHAKKAFYEIESPDLVSWNAVIAAFADSDDVNEAISIFCQMMHTGLMPDDITFLSLLCACGSPVTLNQGTQIHSYIIKIGLDREAAVCNSLLTMYTKCSNLHDAFSVFKDISNNANLVSWNAILSSCLQHKQAGEAFRLFKRMLFSENKPDNITITTILGTCAELASLEVGNQVHCFSVKSGLVVDVSVSNRLIDMYAKCGSLKHARDVFDSTQNTDVVSWSSLIVGYAQFGLGHEALNLFRMMRNLGIQPNEITYLGVLSACSHIGLVEEGWHLYKTMEVELGIPPTRELVSCMVDLLARAGCLYEAENFIKKTGLDPDITMWKTLLASCKTHGNVDIAERAAENILKIDPCNSAALVLLSNIHASAGNWKEFARLRNLMKQMGVQKVPGQSWIEVKDKIHVFFSEDSSHPQRAKICTMLEDLWLQMLDDGYDPSQSLDISIW